MSNTKLNCCKCGKEFGFTERIYTCGDLWQCEDCAIKQMQENDNKDKTIADLEAKLAEKENEQLKQQLAEKDKEILDVKNWWSYQYEGEKQRHNQDKIELLKKVKDLLFDKAGEITGTSIAVVRLYSIIEIFDNQIEELKKENSIQKNPKNRLTNKK